MGKLLIVCGPTATGKTATALTLAQKFNGELVSADSRQVYEGMDIGTGKDLPENAKLKVQNAKLKIKNQKFTYGYYDLDGIKLWLIDLARPDQEFSIAHYREIANRTIHDIWSRGKLPIVVGGTGLYIKAILEPIDTIDIPQNADLRQKLHHKSTQELASLLQEKDSDKWQHMNNSDRQNSRRLVRAIEVAEYKKKNTKYTRNSVYSPLTSPDTFFIGLTAARSILDEIIVKRVEKRIKQGILDEIRSLLSKGYSWSFPAMSATGYADWQGYFEGSRGFAETVEKWKLREHDYARRQLVWFHKNPKIKWFDVTISSYRKDIEQAIEKWYTG